MEKSNEHIKEGKTIRVRTSCGSLYVVINGNPPDQMFAYLGKSGGCLSTWVDSTTRLIAELLQTGSSVYKVIKILKGFRCPSPYLYPESERVLSCSDALGVALSEYCQLIGREDLLAKPESGSKVNVVVVHRDNSASQPAGKCPACSS